MHFFLVTGLLLYPLINFIRFQNYSLFSPEVLALEGLLTGLAAIIYFALKKKRLILCLVYALLITSLVTANMTERDVSDFVTAGIVLLVVFFLLTRLSAVRLPRVILLFCIGVVVCDVFVHKTAAPFFAITKTSEPLAKIDTISPVEKKQASHILYIVLDEFVSPAGMPLTVSKTPEMQKKIETFYMTEGFTLFSRAFSSYADTVNSLSNVFNFSSVDQDEYYFSPKDNDKTGYHLNQNQMFTKIHDRGYQIKIYQTAKFDLCSQFSDANQCVEYSKNQAQALEGTALGVVDKMWVLGSQFIASHILLGEIATVPVHRNILQPYTGPLRVVPMTLDRVTQDLLAAQKNTFFYTYLGMPHFPYVYDKACQVRPVSEWEHRMKYSGPSRKNSVESYQRKYERYYEQIDCVDNWLSDLFETLKKEGLYDQMTIVIHGDHGSRINLANDPRASVKDSISDQDVKTSFSVFLAIKKPYQKISTVNSQQGNIVKIIQTEFIDGKSYQENDLGFVYLKTGRSKAKMVKIPMVKM